jgi:hypothetical protein
LLAILSLKSNFSKKPPVNIAFRTVALAAINQWQKKSATLAAEVRMLVVTVCEGML